MKAAKGGNTRAMYNASLCYSLGESGLTQDLQRAKMWMKRAADCGHSKAQFEHGLELFSVCFNVLLVEHVGFINLKLFGASDGVYF